MTETEWFTDTDYHRHVKFVEAGLGPRRARLLAVAFCRAVWDRLDFADMRAAVDVAERYADNAAARGELEDARQAARETAVESYVLYERLLNRDASEAEVHHLRHDMAWAVAFAATSPVPVQKVGERVGELVGATAAGAAVRDIAGNPFRPVAFVPAWRTETVLALARRMYETREFSAMPILADALQDAGCHDDDVLSHCTGGGGHVRGCWVIDGVLNFV